LEKIASAHIVSDAAGVASANGVRGVAKAKKGALGKKYVANFKAAMDDNFNTPKVVALLLEMAKVAQKEKDASLIDAYKEMGKILGIDFAPAKKKPLPAALKKLIKDREAARKAKDWVQSDKLRDELASKGVLVEDSAKGSTWKWA